MLMTRRRVLLWLALAALSFAPTISGAMPVFHGARYLPYTVAIFSICSFSFTQSKLLQRGAGSDGGSRQWQTISGKGDHDGEWGLAVAHAGARAAAEGIRPR